MELHPQRSARALKAVRAAVAVWTEGDDLYVLSPCGRCREFIRQMHPDNIRAEVVLDVNKSAPLKELLPYHDWLHKTTL